MALDFVAIDIETAASKWNTICEIALVRVRDGAIAEEFSSLIDPECDFTFWNTRVHGLTADDVAGAPCFNAVAADITKFIGEDMLVSHNMSFDANSLFRAYSNYSIDPPCVKTLCTLLASRIVAADLPNHRLPAVCEHFHVDLGRHHRALDDARACAGILIAIADAIEADSVEAIVSALRIDPGKIDAAGTVSPSSLISASNRAGNPYSVLNDLRDRCPEFSQDITIAELKDNRIAFKCCNSVLFYHAVRKYDSFIRIPDIDDGENLASWSYRYKNGDLRLPASGDLDYEAFMSRVVSIARDKYAQQSVFTFGCCNDFIACSDAMRCLKSDDTFYRGCLYRKNLEAGRIFYGKNANIAR